MMIDTSNILIFVIIVIALLAVLDAKIFIEYIRKQHLTPKAIIKQTLYVTTALAFYALVGWVVHLPLPSLSELQNMFASFAEDYDHGPDITAIHLLGLAIALYFSYYAGSLVDYVVHRWFSHSKTFWWTHEYHHVPKQVMVLMPGIAVRPYSFFMSIPTACGIFAVYTLCFVIFSLPYPLYPFVILVFAVQVLVLVSAHSSFCRRQILLHRILQFLNLTTPREHILHHAAHLQGNFGNMSTVWDKIFGTYLSPEIINIETTKIGVAYDQDFFGAVTNGFIKLPEKYKKLFGVEHYSNLSQPENE